MQQSERTFIQKTVQLADVLKLVQKQKWPIYCDIELEYDVPADSDAAKEVKKCADFAKAILIGMRMGFSPSPQAPSRTRTNGRGCHRI